MYVVSYSDPPLGGLMGGLGSRLCPDVSFVYSITGEMKTALTGYFIRQ